MKFNKKLVVTSLSTVLGLGIVGSITGTIAWYQYSTRGTATVVGMSAGRSGVLHLRTDSNYDDWKTDVKTKDFFYTKSDEVKDEYKTDEILFEENKNYYDGESWSYLEDNVFYFKNTGNWGSVYAYAFNMSSDPEPQEVPNAVWPGQKMSLVDSINKVYKIELDGEFSKIIFNNGENREAPESVKTGELSFADAEGKHLYTYDEQNPSWSLYVYDTYYYKKPAKWPSVYSYAWSQTGAEKNANFPGQLMSEYDAQESIYKVVYPSTYDKVTFFNGGLYREDNKLRPCTFGGMGTTAELPANAYGNPVSGYKSMSTWNPAHSDSEYFQFTVQLKAVDKSGAQDELVERKVWIRQIVLEDADDNPTITDALRMHLHVSGGSNNANYVISNQASSIDCYGKLDVNDDGKLDTAGGLDFDSSAEPIDYGEYVGNELQTKKLNAFGIDDVVAPTFDERRVIGSTIEQVEDPSTETQEYLTVTITIWIEGWAKLGAENNKSAIWGPETLNRTIHAGIEFDVSDKAFNEN